MSFWAEISANGFFIEKAPRQQVPSWMENPKLQAATLGDAFQEARAMYVEKHGPLTYEG